MDVVSDAIAAVRIGRPSTNRLRAAGSWSTRLSPYEGAGFHVVLEGSCRLLLDGSDSSEPLTLRTGDAVLLPHGTGHVLMDAHTDPDPATASTAVPFERLLDGSVPRPPRSGPGQVELLCGKYRLDRSRTHPLMAELPPVVHLPNRVGGHPELRAAIDLLGGELLQQRPGGQLAVPSLLDLLLVYMVRAWLAEGPAGAWSAALGDPVTAAALRALHADPAADWTNDRLAAAAGVSRPTLARRFTAQVGRPPMAYLTWWRLTSAATLLRDTSDPLAAIAHRVGYGTPYAFSHAFTRHFGTTPGRYRARAAGPETETAAGPAREDGTRPEETEPGPRRRNPA